MNPSALKESTEPMPDQQQVNGNSLGAEWIRLNLGGRDKPIKGFLTVDLSKEHAPDVFTDVSDLSMFETNSVDEIYASQILEHFPHTKTADVLKEWYRVLKPRAKITIGVPDFARAIEIYQQCGMVDWVRNFLYGDQGYPLAFHYTGFTFSTLAKEMDKVGFREVKRIAKMPYGIRDCSSNVSSMDKKNVNLLVEAVK